MKVIFNTLPIKRFGPSGFTKSWSTLPFRVDVVFELIAFYLCPDFQIMPINVYATKPRSWTLNAMFSEGNEVLCRGSGLFPLNTMVRPAPSWREQWRWRLRSDTRCRSVRGISSNYACQNCCGNSFYDGWVTPVQESSFEGAQIQFIAMQQDANCYGQVYPPYQAGSPSYSSSDTSICNTGFSTGTTTGVGPGEALINAGWTADAWFFGPFGVCDYTPEEVLRDAICNIIACLCAGTPFTNAEWNTMPPDFPNLQRCQVRKQAAATATYNCLAWTIDDTSRWWWFEADANGDNKISVSELHAFYSSKGKSNIAYYGNSTSDVLHVAKKAGGAGTGCPATSKLGMEIRLAHDLQQLEGGVYSNIVGGN